MNEEFASQHKALLNELVVLNLNQFNKPYLEQRTHTFDLKEIVGIFFQVRRVFDVKLLFILGSCPCMAM